MKHVAEILSAIFIPLLAPTYLCVILMAFLPGITGLESVPNKVAAAASIFTATCSPPSVIVYAFFRNGRIASLTLENRKDRRVPQIAGCINYILVTAFLKMHYGARHIFSLCMLATT